MSTATPAAPPPPHELIKKAIAQLTSIATLPEVTTKIIKLVEDPKSTPAQLHAVVSHDPALVTRILKVVNSSFYGLPGQIASVERAIVMLGLNAVKNIAVGASLGQMFRGAALCGGMTAKDLWAHCVAVAVASRELAREMKVPLADEAFLAGMIHDIGILVALQVWPEATRATCDAAQKTGRAFIEIEREMIGVDHAQLGQALAEKWQFPRSCQLVAGYHHAPDKLPDGSRLLVGIVHIADVLCAQNLSGFNLTAGHDDLTAGACAALGVDWSVVEKVRLQLPALLERSASMMG